MLRRSFRHSPQSPTAMEGDVQQFVCHRWRKHSIGRLRTLPGAKVPPASGTGFALSERMACPECLRLKADRALKGLNCTVALIEMNVAALTIHGYREYVELTARVQEANSDLEKAEAEIMQHQNRHGVPN